MSKKQKDVKPKRGRHADEPPVVLPDERIVNMPQINGHAALTEDEARVLLAGVLEPKKRTYLLSLALLGSRARAATAAGVTRILPWIWEKEDPAFRAAYVRAMEIAGRLHEDEMFRRATEGVVEPVYQGGRLVGGVRRYSDSLLIFALKGAMPDKYADRQKHEHSGSVDVVARLRAARQRAAIAAGKGDDDDGVGE